MPEDRLGVTSRHFEVLEKRSDRVPQVMDLDQPDLVGAADAAEGPDEDPGSTGRPVLVVNTSPLSERAGPGLAAVHAKAPRDGGADCGTALRPPVSGWPPRGP